MSKNKYSLPPLRVQSNPTRKVRIPKLDLGLVNVVSPKDIPLGASPEMDGVRLTQGGIQKDYDYTDFGSAQSSVIQAIHNHRWTQVSTPWENNETFILVGPRDYATATKLYKWESGSWTFKDNLWGAGTPSVGSQRYTALRTVLQTMIACDPAGPNQPEYYDDSTELFSDYGGDVSYMRDVIEFADRAVFVGNFIKPLTIQWTVSGDATDASGVGSGSAELIAAAGPMGVDQLRGLGNIGPSLAIFRQRSIWRGFRTGVTDPAIGFQRWVDGIGTESQFSISHGEGGVLFLGSDRMAYFLNESGFRPISKTIYPYLQDVIDEDDIDLVDSVYDPIDQKWYLGIPENSGGAITAILTFDMGLFLAAGEERWGYRTQAVERLGYTYEEIP